VRHYGWLLAGVVLLAGAAGDARAAWPWPYHTLDKLNAKLHGRIIDFTDNHGSDNRLWSAALGERRDLYVYLPPGFSTECRYPVMLYLHPFSQDEGSFFDFAPVVDAYIASGRLPPMIVAAPDGSIRGRPSILRSGSFYVNSDAGRFEDHVMGEVWPFVLGHFPIRPEREAHILAGASMGGFGAYNLGFKYPSEFGVLAGIMPPLNLRYEDCKGRYFSDFKPDCWRYRDRLKPRDPVARFAGIIVLRERLIIHPLYGRGRDVVPKVAAENPIEMLDSRDIRPGQFELFVGYGSKDEFNIDAQIESFLYVAEQKGIPVTAVEIPNGRHSLRTGLDIFAHLAPWLDERIAPYAPKPLPLSAGPPH
jgi:hypothetical protein